LALSDFLRANVAEVGVGAIGLALASWLVLRREAARRAVLSQASRLPGIRPILNSYRTALFCRNLGILLRSGLTLTSTLRILVNIMAATGNGTVWITTADRVRHGGKLSEALRSTGVLPALAVRMFALGGGARPPAPAR